LGDAARDEVHRLYDEIVMSDTEVDKLVRRTPFSRVILELRFWAFADHET
jgi:hypothetical protein